VDRARDVWIHRLIDPSRRNSLLFFRDLKTGTLDLTHADRMVLTEILAGKSVTLSRLLPAGDEVRTAACAREIRRRALANREEKGLDTLYLTLGMATWAPTDDGRPPESPVLLVPVAIETPGREGRTVSIKRSGDVQANLVLLHTLETSYGCHLSPEFLLGGEAGEDDDASVNPEAAYGRLVAAASRVEGFAINPRVVLGNFSFQKMAMVKDLRERAEEIAAHDLIAAIAGDPGARTAVGATRQDVDTTSLDQIPPENEFLIRDADASQQRVVSGVLMAQDGVIHGPPGTGKSQTIANLIATLAATGRRVLFVAEKRAALEVVRRRLDEVQLGHLALDLHGADISRREVMKQVAQSLLFVRQAAAIIPEELHRRFVERRARLNEHVARLHASRAPSGFSVYELQGRLLRLPDDARATTRWRGRSLDPLDRVTTEAVKDLLVEAGGFGGLFLRDGSSPWIGARLFDGESVQQATDLVARLSGHTWPLFRAAVAAATRATGLRTPDALGEVATLASVLSGINDTLSVYSEALVHEDLDALAAALEPARRGRLASAWTWCINGGFRRAWRTLRRHRKVGRAPVSALLTEVAAAAGHRRKWRGLSSPSAMPRAYPGLETLRESVEALLTDVTPLTGYVAQGDLLALDFDAFERLVGQLLADTETPPRLPRLLQIERAIERHGVGAIVAELRARKLPPPLWPIVFETAWLASCLDRARAEDPALAGFNGRTHDQFVDEFCHLDRDRLALAAARVRRAHAERAIAAMNAAPEQDAIVRREAAKMTSHLPLRKLVAAAPDVLVALRPCWMASPLSVSQLLPADRRYFDVVIFDEASQVLPEDAVAAVLRGAHTVVAGDRHQLPPTTFFAGGEDEEEEAVAGPVAGFESVLDLMTSFLEPWPLEWHYRSLDESLIAFSNRHIYRDSLITFPGCGGPPAVEHVLVPHPTGRDGFEDSPLPEIQRVVQLVLEHAEQRPTESLGVIALGIKHALRVEAAVDAALRNRADLDPFFDQQLAERFFVKNLERVQGDERDAIILTLGAGKDRADRLDYRQFGPLNQKGGERRLNVAITRARRRLTLVSSFAHTDMDPDRSGEGGVELLRLYLEYVASRGARLGDPGPSPIPLNAFELDVYDTLATKGLTLFPQWGASQYRIDMVAQHPARPGRFVLAIECDGASYHSAYTARDRDRLRQQHLEALGWRFLRIWSTDWFMRRDAEVSRALAAFDAAVAHADRIDAAIEAPPPRDSPPPGAREGQAAGTASHPGRGPRPPIQPGRRINEYRDRELDALVRWIQSDGCLRTDDEITDEMIETLGFHHRGRRIVSAIREAIARVLPVRPGDASGRSSATPPS
jgi:very-short-patch-repair endonuclease